MPIKIRKLPGKRRYRVTDGGRVTARSTTKAKAESQRRAIMGRRHGWVPTRRRSR